MGTDHHHSRVRTLRDNIRLQLRLGPLRDAGKGRTVVLLGNGPSLNHVDPEALRNVTTIGSNFVHLFGQGQGFLPDVISCTNRLVVEQGREIFESLTEVAVMVPSYCGHLLDDGNHLSFVNINHDGDFSPDIVDGASTHATVTYFNLQLAGYLGFDTIVLVGFDHQYTQPGRGRHGALIDQSTDDINHFDHNYFRGKTWQRADTDEMARVYALAQSRMPETKIINATVGGALEEFPRAQLDVVLPHDSEPIDLSPLRQAAPETDRVLVSVNPNARDLLGHHLNFDIGLRREANRVGVPFASLVDLAVERPAERDHAWVVPTFSARFSPNHAGSTETGLLSGFAKELSIGLDIIRAASDCSNIDTFWYMANLEYVLESRIFEDAKVQRHLHLFYAYEYDLADRDVRLHLETLLDKAGAIPNLELSLGTVELADQWREQLGVDLPVFPSAPRMLFEDRDRPVVDRTDRTRLFFPGTTSLGKGHQDMVAIAGEEAWLAESGLDLTVRDVGTLNRRARRVLKRAASRGLVSVVDGTCRSDELRQLYLEAAVVVIPYRANPFAPARPGRSPTRSVPEHRWWSARGHSWRSSFASINSASPTRPAITQGCAPRSTPLSPTGRLSARTSGALPPSGMQPATGTPSSRR